MIHHDAIIQMTTEHRKDDFGGQLLHYTGVIAEIDSAPTVDAEEVVRCKDCIYRTKMTAECVNNGGVWGDEDFCSDGKRREDGT